MPSENIVVRKNGKEINKEIDTLAIEANKSKINSLQKKDYNYLFRDILDQEN